MDEYVKMVKDIRKHFKEDPEFEKECKELAEEIISKQSNDGGKEWN